MSNTPESKFSSDQDYIEAAQLIGSHRKPVVWLLVIQIAVLGTLSIWLTGLTGGAQIAMIALLLGFLWSGSSFWLMLFCVVVFGGQMFRISDWRIVVASGDHLAECTLILLTLIAGFRYVELRRYEQAFGLDKSYRSLKTNSLNPWSWLTLILGQFIRRQWYHSLIAIVFAFTLLWRFPASEYYRQEFWTEKVAGRFIFLSLTLFAGWFISRAVISIWDWFLMTPRQADVAIRSWANREFWTEIAGVERRRDRLRKLDEE